MVRRFRCSGVFEFPTANFVPIEAEVRDSLTISRVGVASTGAIGAASWLVVGHAAAVGSLERWYRLGDFR